VILVGCGFNFKRCLPVGLEAQIDDDRKAVLLVDEAGMYCLSLFNGQRRTNVALTPETADAVIDVLLRARTVGIDQGEIESI
jgi:hypothetical protein